MLKFGFELETALKTHPHLIRSKYIKEIKYDGSICIDGSYSILLWAREITTKVFNYPADVEKVKRFIRWLFDRHIHGDAVNDTMGMHIHVSFDSKVHEVMIFSRRFKNFFLREIRKRYREMWEKRHRNQYCRAWYRIDYFEKVSSDSRYKAINYIDAWYSHGTFEFRIFQSPKTAKECIDYLMTTLTLIQQFIEKYDDKFDELFGKEIKFDFEATKYVKCRIFKDYDSQKYIVSRCFKNKHEHYVSDSESECLGEYYVEREFCEKIVKEIVL